MPLKEIQKQVDDRIKQYKVGYFGPFESLARLMEEVGELAREINHLYGPKKKKATEEIREMSDEIADIIFALVCLANSKGIDLDEAFKRLFEEKLDKRDKNRWEKKDGNEK